MEIIKGQILGYDHSLKGDSPYHAIDPSNGLPLENVFYSATSEEIRKACELASKAFERFRNTKLNARAAFLRSIADGILSLGEDLIEMCHRETGLDKSRLEGERKRTVDQLRFFASIVEKGDYMEAVIETGDATRVPVPKPDLRRMLIPLGPVAVFGAGNFPFAFSVAGGDTAAALAAGCPVIYKVHPGHPGTSALVGEVVMRSALATGMPSGVFSMIHGNHHDIGKVLVAEPAVEAVAFTGSRNGAAELQKVVNNREQVIPFCAEMGSLNPVFLLPQKLSERPEKTALRLFDSVILGTGQFCTSPGMIFYMKSEAGDRMVEKLISLFGDKKAGFMSSPEVAKRYREGIENMVEDEGLVVLAKGIESEGICGVPHLLATDLQTYLSNRSLQLEIFGPSTVLVGLEDEAEFYSAAENMDGSLTATVYASEKEWMEYEELIRLLAVKAGRIIYNGVPTGVEVSTAMFHGGPFPASSDVRFSSVGSLAMHRFLRPVSYQDAPEEWLPEALQAHNPLQLERMVNGKRTRENL